MCLIFLKFCIENDDYYFISATEFRLILGRPGGESPLVSCAPRTPARSRPIVLRAPSIDLKAVWQSLLQRQM